MMKRMVKAGRWAKPVMHAAASIVALWWRALPIGTNVCQSVTAPAEVPPPLLQSQHRPQLR